MLQVRLARRVLFPTFAVLVFLAAPLLAQEAPQPGLMAFEGIAVGPADRADVSRLTDAGVVSIEGGRSLVITVAGELRGRTEKEGAIGVILLPDLVFFNTLYRNRRTVLSAAEVTAPVASGESGYFMSKTKNVETGFSRYRLLLFNTTGTAVSANVYVYSSRS